MISKVIIIVIKTGITYFNYYLFSVSSGDLNGNKFLQAFPSQSCRLRIWAPTKSITLNLLFLTYYFQLTFNFHKKFSFFNSEIYTCKQTYI